MRVYRCISAREITAMYKGKNEREALLKGQNTHKYEISKKYIHFFRYSQSAEYFKDTLLYTMNPLDKYVAFMTANIPNNILKKYIGYGIYNSERMDLEHLGYVPLPEYAIPEEEFSKDFIVQVNTQIDSRLKSDYKEYRKYLLLIDILFNKYKNLDEVLKIIQANDLEKILDVKDDDRTEEKRTQDELEKLKEVFSKEDFLKD